MRSNCLGPRPRMVAAFFLLPELKATSASKTCERGSASPGKESVDGFNRDPDSGPVLPSLGGRRTSTRLLSRVPHGAMVLTATARFFLFPRALSKPPSPFPHKPASPLQGPISTP
jgi:hypothetical protein